MTAEQTPVEDESAGSGDAAGGSSAGPEAAAAADAVTLAPPVAPVGAPATPLGAPGLGAATPGLSVPPADYTQAGVPSLDFVRDKIEGRYAQSLGSTELAAETPEARSFEEQATKRAEAAKERLDAIRRSLRGDSSS